MRIAASAALAALPFLASVQGNPFSAYKSHLQKVLDRAVSSLPNPGTFDPVTALEAKLGSMKLSVLTLENWKQTLYEPVLPGATTPEEWWVLITGRNKTCYGQCAKIEQAFNKTAAKFALASDAPRMAYLNCDDQPILCNSWVANSGYVWSFAMLPPPSPIEVNKRKLNLTTTTSEHLLALKDSPTTDAWTPVESWFHPFNGMATELGLAIPCAYVIWAFSRVPNWLFMVVVSFASRRMLPNRMNTRPGQAGRPGARPAAAGR